MRIAFQPTAYRLRPVTFDLFRPGLVPTLLGELDVSVDGRRLTIDPSTVGRDGISGLITLVERRDRILPVIVASPDPATRRPLIDVIRTSSVLAGLAHVFAIDDPQATFDLTHAVGKHHSVFLGAVRLYWPGWERSGDPFAHPLWLADTLRTEGLGSRLPNELLRMIASVAAMRVPETSLGARIMDALGSDATPTS